MKRITIALLGLLLLAGLTAVAQPKLTIWADDVGTPVFRDIAAGFTAVTGVEVEVVEIAFSDIRGQFNTAAPTGEGPDLLVGAHDWVGELVVNGLLDPIDLSARIDEFNPVAIDGFSYGGLLYGVPYGVENVALLYNKDLVPTPPATWDELMQIARDITDVEAGVYGYIVQNPDPFHWFPMLSACGGYIFGKNEDGSLNPCDVGLNDPGAVFGAILFDEMIEEGILANGVDWDTMTGVMFSGNGGMVISGPWLIGSLRDAGINYGVAPIPSFSCDDGTVGIARPFAGVRGVMLNSFSKNKTIATEFLLKYIATEETALELFALDPRPPALLSAFDQVKSDPDVATFGEVGQNAIPMPNIAEMSSVWGAWSDAQALIGNQETDPVMALIQATNQILEAIGCE
ncbi:MAG: maltose ABC transporter substrate-binding protein [Candidatus Bipolaricaulota bacterium]|nr:MAG: maltose ABC transporter substrate-binding protein [Candidatus Bipolaricaulota bacterium]